MAPTGWCLFLLVRLFSFLVSEILVLLLVGLLVLKEGLELVDVDDFLLLVATWLFLMVLVLPQLLLLVTLYYLMLWSNILMINWLFRYFLFL